MGATRKTIRKVLNKKFDCFLKSIDDPGLRELTERDAFITGGSIVSLLLAEEIKDFDLYLKTKETAKKLAEYYVSKFISSHPGFDDSTMYVEEKDDRITVFVRSDGIATLSSKNTGELEDIDSDEPPVPEDDNRFRPVFLSSNAITLSDKIQIVLRFYGDPEEVHKNYDFTHCTCFWEAGNNKLTMPGSALESILSKTLYYQGSLYPICSVIRTRKFLKRGWHISAGQYLKMCFQISDLNLNDIEVLQEQLTGVDQAYFQQIINICKSKIEKEPEFKINSAYICEIIDRVFD